jgi:hypothetical protein
MSPSPASPNSQPPVARTDLNSYRIGTAIFWTVVIMALCWLPGSIVQEFEGGSSWFTIPDLDKLVHAGIFIVFSILWARAFSSRGRFAWIALGGLGLAIVTELAQKLPVVGRDGNIADTLTDAAGVLAGIVAAPLVEPLARFAESRIFRKTESRLVRLNRTMVIADGAPRPPN